MKMIKNSLLQIFYKPPEKPPQKESLISSQNQSPVRKHDYEGSSQYQYQFHSGVSFTFGSSAVKSNQGQFANETSKFSAEEISLFHHGLDTPKKDYLFHHNEILKIPPQDKKVSLQEQPNNVTRSDGKHTKPIMIAIQSKQDNDEQNKIKHIQYIINGFFTSSNHDVYYEKIDLTKSNSMQRLKNVLSLLKYLINKYGIQNIKCSYLNDNEGFEYNIKVKQGSREIMLCNNISKGKLSSSAVSKLYLAHLNEYLNNIDKNSHALVNLYIQALNDGILKFESDEYITPMFSARIKMHQPIDPKAKFFNEYNNKLIRYQENINTNLALMFGGSFNKNNKGQIIDSPHKNTKKYEGGFAYSTPKYTSKKIQDRVIQMNLNNYCTNFILSATQNEGQMLPIPDNANHPQFILLILNTFLYNAIRYNLQMHIIPQGKNEYRIILTSGKRELHFYYPLPRITDQYLNDKTSQFKQQLPKKFESIIDTQSKLLINFVNEFNNIDKSNLAANDQAKQLVSKFGDRVREIYDKYLFYGAYDQLEV